MVRKADEMARRRIIVAAKKGQRHELPAARAKATLAAEIASEVLRTKEQIATLEARLEELLASTSRKQRSLGHCQGWDHA